MSTHHTATINSEMTIRRMDLTDSDRDAVARLAGLDSRETLVGPVLGAEVEGRLLAAISLSTRKAIADPFSRTAELQGLLELRAAQIGRRERKGRRGGLGIPGRRNRPAVGGSPAGQIITLPRWG